MWKEFQIFKGKSQEKIPDLLLGQRGHILEPQEVSTHIQPRCELLWLLTFPYMLVLLMEYYVHRTQSLSPESIWLNVKPQTNCYFLHKGDSRLPEVRTVCWILIWATKTNLQTLQGLWFIEAKHPIILFKVKYQFKP